MNYLIHLIVQKHLLKKWINIKFIYESAKNGIVKTTKAYLHASKNGIGKGQISIGSITPGNHTKTK
jgi:hypothetical protein